MGTPQDCPWSLDAVPVRGKKDISEVPLVKSGGVWPQGWGLGGEQSSGGYFSQPRFVSLDWGFSEC